MVEDCIYQRPLSEGLRLGFIGCCTTYGSYHREVEFLEVRAGAISIFPILSNTKMPTHWQRCLLSLSQRCSTGLRFALLPSESFCPQLVTSATASYIDGVRSRQLRLLRSCCFLSYLPPQAHGRSQVLAMSQPFDLFLRAVILLPCLKR